MIPENTGPAAVIVLAAGAGTRMKSRTPKILHEIGGRSMVGHALLAARSINPRQLAVVVRHERELVARHLKELDPAAVIVDQDDIPGTGRAVEVALQAGHACPRRVVAHISIMHHRPRAGLQRDGARSAGAKAQGEPGGGVPCRAAPRTRGKITTCARPRATARSALV